MAGPAKTVQSFVSHMTAPLTKQFQRAFTPPGLGGPPQPDTPPPPPQAGPMQEPTGRSNTERLAKSQLSFLTAASKAAAALGSGASSGKSLLGQ